MTNVRRSVFGVLAAGAACAAISAPSAVADPATDCSTAGLASTVSSVASSLSTYFTAHPDANQALMDATKQSAFSAIGAFNDYFTSHPDEANEIRAIKQPLVDFQNQCGMQVEPAEALVVISEL